MRLFLAVLAAFVFTNGFAETQADESTASAKRDATQPVIYDPSNEDSPVSPRKFGVPGGIGMTRGWYIWQKWNPETWEAEVKKDPPGDDVYSVRVLPWGTTYRHLVYGATPNDLLIGERVNMFFNPDERHSRGYLVHFQDELCQMKGHNHIWEVLTISDAMEPKTKSLKARVLAGGQPFDKNEWTFAVDEECQRWRNGKIDDVPHVVTGDRVFMTWCWRAGQRVAVMIADDASLELIKAKQAAHVAAGIARDGMAGAIDDVDAFKARVTIFANYWSQANQLKPQQAVRLTRTTSGFRPVGETIKAQVVSQKNRGTYGSGVNEVVLQLENETARGVFVTWPQNEIIRIIPEIMKSNTKP